MTRLLLTLVLLCFPQFTAIAWSAPPKRQLGYARPKKKLIEFGWSTTFMDLAAVRANMQRIERIPFDGIALHLNIKNKQYRDAFNHELKVPATEMNRLYDALRSLKWKRYTDNFVTIYTGERHLGKKSKKRMDWFNDQHWDNIVHNIKLITRAAVIGKCKGLVFDPEGYNRNMWNYDRDQSRPGAEHRDRISYPNYCKQVRKRGRQFMTAIQSVMPDVRILSLYHPPRIGTSARGKNLYTLFFPFLNGMLDTAGPKVRIIDGNEFAYSYKSKADFDAGYVDIKRRKQALIAPENRRKYSAQVQVGQALFMDEIFGIHQRKQWTGTYLTYQNRLKLFEQVLFHALDTADEYVWVYSERMNWWLDHRYPEGATDLMSQVKNRINRLGIEKRQLSFSIDAEIAAARAKQKAILASTKRSEYLTPRIAARSALIRRGKGKAPVINGKLDDSAWQKATRLTGFSHHLLYIKNKVKATTTVRVLWDEKGLYLGCQCEEPRIKEIAAAKSLKPRNRIIVVLSNQRQENVHHRVDLSMTRSAYVQIKRAARRWDHVPALDSKVKVAVTLEAKGWTSEVFLPWDCVGGKPESNSARQANIIRTRSPQYEMTNWSKMVDPNLWDTQHLGTWKFLP